MENKDIYGKTYPCHTREQVEKAVEVLTEAVKDLHVGTDYISLIVETEDGECNYGMEMCNVLDYEYLAVGMWGNGTAKIFDASSEAEDAIWWMLEDMEVAVGEEFSFTLTYEETKPL